MLGAVAQPPKLLAALAQRLGGGHLLSSVHFAVTHLPTGSPHSQICPGPQSVSRTHPYEQLQLTAPPALCWQKPFGFAVQSESMPHSKPMPASLPGPHVVPARGTCDGQSAEDA
jgi:hypothetical protein